MIKRLFSSKGFTLVEVMVAMGVMSIGALGVMQMAQVQSNVQRKAKDMVGIAQVVNIIQRNLSKNASCTNTFAGFNGYGPNRLAPDIRGVGGVLIARSQGSPGAGSPLYPDSPPDQANVSTIGISEIRMVNNEFADDATTGIRRRSFYLNISFQALGTVGAQQRTAQLPFPILIRQDIATGNLIECATEEILALDSALMSSCENVGGLYDAPTKVCTLAVYPGASPGGVATELTSLQYLRARLDAFMTTLPALYASRRSDNDFTGTLTMASAATGSNTVTQSSGATPTNPKDAVLRGHVDVATLRGFRCPGGLTGFIRNNSFTCQDLTCPPTQYLKGIDSAGRPLCLPLINTNGLCPSGGRLDVVAGGTIQYVCN